MLRVLLIIIAIDAASMAYSCTLRNGTKEEPTMSAGPANIIPSKNECMKNCIEQGDIGCKKFDDALEGLCDSYLQK
jgi:hypothetical protein